MPVRTLLGLRDLHRISQEQTIFDLGVIREKPLPPDNMQGVGLKFGFRIQWNKVNNVDGYRVIVMTGSDAANPDVILPVVTGDNSLEITYEVGDVAITRTFAVQSVKDGLFSDLIENTKWLTLTSKVDGGAADSAPTQSPDQPQKPEGAEKTDDPGRIGKPGS